MPFPPSAMIISSPLPACTVDPSNWRHYQSRELYPIAEREACALGASRLSDLTGLDQLQTPCWQVTRPTALEVDGNVSVLTGKGWNEEAAALGAYMEFIERHWAERSQVPYIIARPSELSRKGEWFVPLAVMPLPLGISDPGDQPLAWISGTTLQGQQIWVPAHDVICPFVVPAGANNPPIWRSNGLAAGGHLTEAVFYGLLEVIERDAMAVAELAQAAVSVDVEKLPSESIQGLLANLPELGIELEVKQLPAIGDVYAFAAFLDDRESANPMRLVGGHGAHVDPVLAVEAAILEAVQTRAVVISGAREDLAQYEKYASLNYKAARQEAKWWFDPTEERVSAPLTRIPTPQNLKEVIHQIEQSLRGANFFPVIFIQLSPPESQTVVVRVIVPTCSEISHGYRRLGRRFLVREDNTDGS